MVACVGVGVVMPFPGFVVVAGGATVDDDKVVLVAARVVEVELVDEVVDEVVNAVEVVEELGAGSPWASTQYDFPTSTAHVAGREGF